MNMKQATNIETWYKITCPECGRTCWLCVGDLEDLTVPDTEAIRCPHCKKKFFLSNPEDLYDSDEPYVNTGLLHPF